jgi:hypothetical protein
MRHPAIFRLMAAVALCCAVTIPLATPASAHATRSWPAGVPLPKTPNCAFTHGGTPVIPSRAELLPGGGYAYDFKLAGIWNQYIVPPASFHPLTASAAKRAEYGFPQRPAGGATLSDWNRAMATYKSVPSPSICLGTHKSTRPRPAAAPAQHPSASNYYYNWAGANVYASGNSYVAAEGSWGQSSVHNCGCSGATDESSWAGIGGVYDGALVQAGTDMTNTSTHAWYEYLHDCTAGNPATECGPSEIFVGTVTNGDTIYTQTSYEYSNDLANFFVEQNSHSFPIKSKSLDHTYYSGRSAEWIDERPSYCASGCYKPLTNFLYNDWTDVQAESSAGTWHAVGNITDRVYDIMENTAGNILVQPSALCAGCSTFKDTWKRAS